MPYYKKAPFTLLSADLWKKNKLIANSGGESSGLWCLLLEASSISLFPFLWCYSGKRTEVTLCWEEIQFTWWTEKLKSRWDYFISFIFSACGAPFLWNTVLPENKHLFLLLYGPLKVGHWFWKKLHFVISSGHDRSSSGRWGLIWWCEGSSFSAGKFLRQDMLCLFHIKRKGEEGRKRGLFLLSYFLICLDVLMLHTTKLSTHTFTVLTVG